MPVAIAASLLGLLVVLIAYYRDPPLVERRVVPPDWDLLPDPADVARSEFPVAVPGYDPATVELHFDLLTRAYADLLAASSPDVVARARHRIAVRRGIDPDTIGTMTPAGSASPVATTALGFASAEGPDAEALRAEAALADLESAPPPEGDRT